MVVLTPGCLDRALKDPGFKSIANRLGLDLDSYESRDNQVIKRKCCGGQRATAVKKARHRDFCLAVLQAGAEIHNALVAYFGTRVYVSAQDYAGNKIITKVLQ
jgi:hypothetical protein